MIKFMCLGYDLKTPSLSYLQAITESWFHVRALEACP